MFNDFFPKNRREVDRKLPEKQVKKVQQISLKLFPSTPKLQINQPVANTEYIYIYTRGDLPLYRDRVFWNPQVKFQSRIVDTISKFRHPVVKGSKSRQRQ